jgi:hypothetical protein
MKLFDAFKAPGYHTTIATSFAVDFPAYEQIALARLREAGCMNNIVVADARMLTLALDDPHRPPKSAGRDYSLVGAETRGLFHPKLTLQLGPDRARLIVASANLTGSGLAGNLEVAGEVRADPDDLEHISVIRQALAFIESFIPPTEPGARKQIDWCRSHCGWLQTAGPQGTGLAQLLTSRGPVGIGQRFIDAIGNAKVARLVIVSPYWDEDLAAVNWLQKALRPRETALVIQSDRGLFPRRKRLNADVYEAAPVIYPADRFAHAKVIVVQTRDADHVLFGSTNATSAALGTATGLGSNVEAALYRKMDADAAMGLLELEKALAGPALEDRAIAPYARGEDIPLQQAAQRQPGRFHLSGNLLMWTPAPAFDRSDAVLELLDESQLLVATPPAVGTPQARVFQVDLAAAPWFARIRVGQRVSAVGVVHVENLILQNLRMPKTKKIQDGLDKLDEGGDGFEGLFIYEALEIVIAEERKFVAGGSRGRRKKQVAPTKVPATLSYEDFVRVRQEGKAPDLVPANSLDASHSNEVRGMINAVIGIAVHEHEAGDETESLMPLGMGDEVANAEEAIEGGIEVPPEPEQTETASRERAARQASRAQDTEEAIASAVKRFNDRIGEVADQRELTSRDLLRVRVLLTVILAAGSMRVFRRLPTPGDEVQPPLLARGDRGWPRLAGQVLLRLFGNHGPDDIPLIQLVRFDAAESGDGPSVDVLECLATCFWVVGALILARDERGAGTEVAMRAQQRAEEIYGITQLDPAVLMGEEVLKVMRALGNRYGKRLGVDPDAVAQFHELMSAAAPMLQAAA